MGLYGLVERVLLVDLDVDPAIGDMVEQSPRQLGSLGWTPIAGTPDDFAAVIKSDLARWAEAFKASGGAKK